MINYLVIQQYLKLKCVCKWNWSLVQSNTQVSKLVNILIYFNILLLEILKNDKNYQLELILQRQILYEEWINNLIEYWKLISWNLCQVKIHYLYKEKNMKIQRKFWIILQYPRDFPLRKRKRKNQYFFKKKKRFMMKIHAHDMWSDRIQKQ